MGHGVIRGGAVSRNVLDRVLHSPRLPSLPTIALEVLALAKQPDVDFQQIAHTIQHDPALSTRILRTVNSSFYGYADSISTIGHALVVLGLNEARTTRRCVRRGAGDAVEMAERKAPPVFLDMD